MIREIWVILESYQITKLKMEAIWHKLKISKIKDQGKSQLAQLEMEYQEEYQLKL